MSQILPSLSVADPTAQLLAFLTRLGRPGARLRISSDGLAIAAKSGLRDGSSKTTPVPPGLVQAARAAGFLVTLAAMPGSAQDGPCEVLSPAGRAAVRAGLMAQPASPDVRRAAKRTLRRDTLAAGGTPKRPAEKLALVEQLGLRRDAYGRPLLNEMQVAAALRLAQDFAIGGMQPRVTARWSADAIPERRRRGAPGAGVDLSAATTAAQARVRSALALLGGDMADLTLSLCCFEQGLESIEAARRWPARSARIVLGLALNRLAEHYGMIVKPNSRPAATRQWGEHGFKPSAKTRIDDDTAA